MAEISIAIQKNGVAHRATVHAEVVDGQWAAHESYGGSGFKVTHLLTGLALPFDFVSAAQAKRAARAIADLRDWDDSAPGEVIALENEIIAICKKSRGIAVFKPRGDMVPVSDLPVA